MARSTRSSRDGAGGSSASTHSTVIARPSLPSAVVSQLFSCDPGSFYIPKAYSGHTNSCCNRKGHVKSQGRSSRRSSRAAAACCRPKDGVKDWREG